MSAGRPVALTSFSLDELPSDLTGGVAAIGNFDGVHRGHEVLLRAAIAEARGRGTPSLVLTFEPHPRTLFRPDQPVFRLTSLAAKARLLAQLGVDGLAVIRFDRAFASIDAGAFADEILHRRLEIAGAVVGPNFRYGRGRAGSTATLVEDGAIHGFSVTVVEPVMTADGVPVSSSTIRDALAAGDIETANALLGHRWFVIGEVIPGDRRGRELGFPTANMRLPPDCRLRHGIYAVTLTRADGSVLGGVASYGRRPTFDNGSPLLETFALDFSGDLYGEEVTIKFLSWIRAEARFDSVESLIAAMHQDVAMARARLAIEPA
jgi:riboflavin kinase / FMN adenylyltransferase